MPPDGLDEANRRAFQLLEEIRREYQTERTSIIVSGCVARVEMAIGIAQAAKKAGIPFQNHSQENRTRQFNDIGIAE